ncbi:MAG TPA: hypothetical protein VFW33_23595 [Gemmataceae bacterium]|nr:hypothetical protein [Gemmataceae bacterium]
MAHIASAKVMFGKWEKDEKNNRLRCPYTYTNKNGTTSTQYMIWYPDDDDRRGYYYFTTSDHKAYWGRCVCPANPAFDRKVMQWAKLDKKQEWNDLKRGECPAPGDAADPANDQIDSLPPPPK